MILPTGVSLSANTASVWNWATYQLEAYITPDWATNNKIHWSASNNNVTVDENGLVTWVTDGTSVVTATTDYGGYTASCTFTVFTIHVTWVTLNESELSLSAWDTFQLEAVITPSNATNKNVTRRSTDTSIATVDSNWLVTCIDDWECQIIVTTVDWRYTASCDVIPWFPKEYQQVEWIQSWSNQYIDTWYYPTNNTKVEFKISNWTETWSHQIFWEDVNWSSWDWGFSIVTDAYHFNGPVSCSHWMNNWWVHEWEFSQQWLYVDWVLKATPATTTFTASQTMSIFCLHRNGSYIEYSNNKLYYFKIYENWVLQMDFVPCYRKSDWVIWLWDKVWKQFYPNQGSGTFGKGNDVNVRLKDFDELEYIQSDWNQRIDTNYIPKAITEFDISFSPYSYVWTYCTVMGTRVSTSANAYLFWYYASQDRCYVEFSPQNTDPMSFSWRTLWTTYNLSYHNKVFSDWTNTLTLNHTQDCTLPLYIFIWNNNWSAIESSSIKLFSLTLYENWEQVRDFMPAKRKSDWTVGLVDKVNMVFYTNSWSWTFTAGPKLWVSLDTNSISLTEAWQTYQLTATPNPSSVWAQWYQWRSSDTAVATVSSTWLVTCITPGECVITVTAVATWDTDTCSVKEITETIIKLDFNDNNEVTNKWFTFWPSERNWVSASNWQMVVNGGSNDSWWSIIYDVSNYDKWVFQARVYVTWTSRGGDQHVAVWNWWFGDNNLRYWYNPWHHLNMTTASGYTWNSWIWTWSSQWNEYWTYFSWWYVYEISYDNWTYTMTRYNDTQEVTETSTYTHRKTFSWLAKAWNVWIWLRYGFSSQNYNVADWAIIKYYS